VLQRLIIIGLDPCRVHSVIRHQRWLDALTAESPWSMWIDVAAGVMCLTDALVSAFDDLASGLLFFCTTETKPRIVPSIRAGVFDRRWRICLCLRAASCIASLDTDVDCFATPASSRDRSLMLPAVRNKGLDNVRLHARAARLEGLRRVRLDLD